MDWIEMGFAKDKFYKYGDEHPGYAVGDLFFSWEAVNWWRKPVTIAWISFLSIFISLFSHCLHFLSFRIYGFVYSLQVTLQARATYYVATATYRNLGTTKLKQESQESMWNNLSLLSFRDECLWKQKLYSNTAWFIFHTAIQNWVQLLTNLPLTNFSKWRHFPKKSYTKKHLKSVLCMIFEM